MAITKAQVKAWNDKFKSLSKAEQRVEIAKDILKQLRAKKYIASRGSYIVGLTDVDEELDIRSNFDKVQNCQCCALGACLLSVTKYKNKLKFNDVQLIMAGDNDSWSLLKEIFTVKQIAILEYMFEGGSGTKVAEYSFQYYLDENTRFKCSSFRYKYDSDDARLKAICKNIINNKGDIKP